MSYFQNPFDQEFRGTWVLGDRQYSLNFNIGGNVNSAITMLAWQTGPYDCSTNNTLTIKYAVDPTLKQFQTIAVNVAGAAPATTQPHEVAAALNANAVFASLWAASFRPMSRDVTKITVLLQAKRDRGAIRAYVANTGAEKALRFNRKAPIAELPTYFARHTTANALAYPDSFGTLVQLDASDAYTQSIITEQGFDYTTVQKDWQLLKGRAGLFNFRKQVLDGSSRVSYAIDYPAGAAVGDLSKKTDYTYTGAATTPSAVMESPYLLTSGDLVTPP